MFTQLNLPFLRRVAGSTSRLSSCALLLVVSCSYDERSLSVTARPAELGSGSGAANLGLAGSSTGGAAGMAGDGSEPTIDAGGGGAAGVPSAGGAGAAGVPSTGAGGAAGLSPVDSGGESGGVATGGSGGSFVSPCGDIDGNAVDDCAETLLQNSRFDTTIEHWTASSPPTEVWDPRDARAAASSGSLSLSNSAPVADMPGFVSVAAEQCLQVTGDLNYLFAARVLIPSGQGSGQAAINLWVFANDNCQGTFVDAFTPAATQSDGAWTVISGQLKMPTAGRSMVVRLAAARPFAQTHFQVLFDDVLVKQD